ncbi:MAG: hypothetical protein KDN05_02215 [Verrucomicrobiae bacterium]|nr:hypothetical protein [Verrucomicrobiae bacterium]MCP5533270.1 hypothetical protein [Akkermansiaceae bacterium]
MSEPSRASFTIPSLLAVLCAIASFFQGATFGLLLAIGAILFGAIGLLLSLSAKKRGGLVSFGSVAMGFIGIIAAIIKGMLYLFG